MMKRMNRVILALVLTFSVLRVHAAASAKNEIDSLRQILRTTQSDSLRVMALNKLAVLYRNNAPDTAIGYAGRALQLSKKINFTEGMASAQLWIGTAIANKGDFPSALRYLGNARVLFVELLKDHPDPRLQKILSQVLNNMGVVYDSEGNYPETLRFYLASLKIRESIGDKRGAAMSYNNIGLVYKAQGNFSEALRNYMLALHLKEELKDKPSQCATLGNIGTLYKDQGKYGLSLEYQLKALALAREANDLRVISSCYGNLGILYNIEKNYELAKKYFVLENTLREKSGDIENLCSG